MEKIILKGTSQELKCGSVVKHFKREIKAKEGILQTVPNYGLYRIIATVQHSETREWMVLYSALYDLDGERGFKEGDMFVRPLDMFTSFVDKEKYPDVTQCHRFELYRV